MLPFPQPCLVSSLIDRPTTTDQELRNAFRPIGLCPAAPIGNGWRVYHQGEFIGSVEHTEADGASFGWRSTRPDGTGTAYHTTPVLAGIRLLTCHYIRKAS